MFPRSQIQAEGIWCLGWDQAEGLPTQLAGFQSANADAEKPTPLKTC